MTDESRAKMSEAKMGNTFCLGKHASDEARAKMSVAKKGKIASAESRERMSVAQMGHEVSMETKEKMSAMFKGKPKSIEHRAKLSAANMGHITSPETRAKLSVSHMGITHTLSPEGRAKLSVAKWKGGLKVSKCKSCAKRRALGFVPLNKPFDGADAHHVSKEYVVYVPHDLHKSIWHNVWTCKNMEQINLLALGYLVQQLEAAA